MAYLITKTDGRFLGVVSDQQLNDKLCSAVLFGEDFENYGQYFNQNIVSRLENYCDVVTPEYPLDGQLWFSASDSSLNLHVNGFWHQIYSQAYLRTHFGSESQLQLLNTLLVAYCDSSGFEQNGLLGDYTSHYFVTPGASLMNALNDLDLNISNTIQVQIIERITEAQAAQMFAPINSPNFTGTSVISGGMSGNIDSIVSTNSVYSLVNQAFESLVTKQTANNIFAPNNSPNFTGNSQAPTPLASDFSTNIATTKFVQDAILTTGNSEFLTPLFAEQTFLPINSPSIMEFGEVPMTPLGTSTDQIASTAFVNAQINANGSQFLTAQSAKNEYAPIMSPNFAGTPSVPTPSLYDDTNKIASTAFLNNMFNVALQGMITNVEASKLYALKSAPNFTGTPTIQEFPTSNIPGNIPATTKFAIGNNSWNNSGGYMELPSGLIIQWGNVVINGISTPLTFNTEFKNNCFSIYTNNYTIGGVSNPVCIAAKIENLNSATVYAISTGTAPSVNGITTTWIAIGN